MLSDETPVVDATSEFWPFPLPPDGRALADVPPFMKPQVDALQRVIGNWNDKAVAVEIGGRARLGFVAGGLIGKGKVLPGIPENLKAKAARLRQKLPNETVVAVEFEGIACVTVADRRTSPDTFYWPDTNGGRKVCDYLLDIVDEDFDGMPELLEAYGIKAR